MIWALHGAVGSSADWRDFAQQMRASHGEVRRLDLWRFLDCCPMPLEKFGDTLAEEIVRVDPEPVLLGYSMGGRLALHALLARPDLWKAAVIVSAHPGLETESERASRREKDAEWSALALKSEWGDFLNQWNTQGVLAGSEMPDRTPLKDRRASIARSFIDWSLGEQENLSARLQEISCPALWMTGEHDKKFTTIAQSAVARLQNGHHRVIAGCGHRVTWEKPAEFSEECDQFLSKHLKLNT
ncbi:MAG: alpha/beta fold hydrolase [Akkermansiaceae bacterium]